MKSYYEKLVEEQGEAAAKAYMRSIRKKVKSKTGTASLTADKRKEIMARVRATRNENQSSSESQEASKS